MLRPFPDEDAPLRAILLLSAALAVAGPARALERPALLYSEPAQGQALRESPTAVRLRFNRPMRLDRLDVFDDGGAVQVVRRSRDAANPALEQRGGLLRLPPGDYRAEWAASSPAGEPIGGTLFFKVIGRQ